MNLSVIMNCQIIHHRSEIEGELALKLRLLSPKTSPFNIVCRTLYVNLTKMIQMIINENRLTDLENELMVAREGRRGM